MSRIGCKFLNENEEYPMKRSSMSTIKIKNIRSNDNTRTNERKKISKYNTLSVRIRLATVQRKWMVSWCKGKNNNIFFYKWWSHWMHWKYIWAQKKWKTVSVSTKTNVEKAATEARSHQWMRNNDMCCA